MTKLAEARAKQLEAIRDRCDVDEYANEIAMSTPSLEADYALLEATQAAIAAQTVECRKCFGEGHLPKYDDYGCEETPCPTCNGRGRVAK
jgi:hypothetical protein